MARLPRPQEKSKNPASVFLKWKSEEKCFEFYNKDTKESIKVELPFKFLFLEHYHTIKGWHGQTDKGIYSNEIYSLGKQELNVRTFGNPSVEIAKGFYKDIKDKIKLSGGSYHRSIYIMLTDGTIANLSLKGVSVGGLSAETSITKTKIDGYSDFYDKNKHLLDNQFVIVKIFQDGKKGATKFSIPIFEMAEPINTEDNKNANKAALTLENYINEYLITTKTEAEQSEVINEEVLTDDIPF